VSYIVPLTGAWFHGCEVQNTGDTALNPSATVAFDTEAYDHGGWYDAGAPTRLTNTTGLTVAVLLSDIRSWVMENGPATDAENWSGFLYLPGEILDDDDYIEVALSQSTGASRNLLGTTNSAGVSSRLRLRVVG
jgi:hypothetical protein